MTIRTPRRNRSISSVTSKGQVTIPAHIRKHLGIGPSDRVMFFITDGRVEITREQSIVERTKGMFKTDMPYLTPQEENDIFEEAMAEEAMKGLR